MKSRFLGVVVLLAATACETVPPTMDPLLFQNEVSRLNAIASIGAIETATETLLARTDLTDTQRADALFLRAEKRLESRYDLPGAIVDFDRFIALSTDDPRVTAAERRKVFASSEIESAQRRLARLQNLTDWFNDKVLMGDLGAAATRYRQSGLTPNESHVFLLKESGYICPMTESETADPVHKFGTLRADVEGAVWCAHQSVS